MVYSFVGEWTSILPTGWTTQYYADLFKDGKLLMGALRGLAISMLPILISGSVVILALYYALLYNPRVERIIQTLCKAPYTIQGIILATSALSLYAGLPGPLGNRLVLLTCVYCIGILPFIYQGIRNGLRTVNLHQFRRVLFRSAQYDLRGPGLGAFGHGQHLRRLCHHPYHRRQSLAYGPVLSVQQPHPFHPDLQRHRHAFGDHHHDDLGVGPVFKRQPEKPPNPRRKGESLNWKTILNSYP